MNHHIYSGAILRFLPLCLLFALFTACSKKPVQTAGVHYKSHQGKAITITSTGYGKNKREAISNAEKNAFDVLLFKGVQGSPYVKPLIPKPESEVKARNASYFENLYDKQAYKGFVTYSNIISPGSKDKQSKKVFAGVEMTINIPSLRRDLEQQGLIKKFGL